MIPNVYEMIFELSELKGVEFINSDRSGIISPKYNGKFMFLIDTKNPSDEFLRFYVLVIND